MARKYFSGEVSPAGVLVTGDGYEGGVRVMPGGTVDLHYVKDSFDFGFVVQIRVLSPEQLRQEDAERRSQT